MREYYDDEEEEVDERAERRARVLMIIRNALNIIFMAGAVVGVVVYACGNREVGMYIVLGAIPFKIVEAALRMLKL